MHKTYSILTLSIFLLFISCGASFGEKYTVGNLEIYFTEEINKDFVENLGAYFVKNGLIGETTQSVQLTSDESSILLKMVLNKDHKRLPKSEENNLSLLEEDIYNTIFRENPAEGRYVDHAFRIVVCNENFIPIQTE